MIWYKMRQKFVKLNLKKSRNEFITHESTAWYRYLTFLEPYISHKGGRAYYTPNRKEVENEVYDELMEYMGVEIEDVIVANGEDVVPLPVDDHDLSETESLEILDGYEDIVMHNLQKNTNLEAPTSPALNEQDEPTRNPLPFASKCESKVENQISRIRARCDATNLCALKLIKQEVINILMAAIMESKDAVLQQLRLDVILSSIGNRLKREY